MRIALKHLKKLFSQEKLEPSEKREYTYAVMAIEVEGAEELLAQKKRWLKNRIGRLVRIEQLSEENAPDFVEVWNKALLTAPDPFRPISLEKAKALPKEGTFIAYLFGKPVGFIVCVVDGEDGAIAGLAVDPSRRRRGIATALAIRAAEYLLSRGVKRVVCDIYLGNRESMAFVKSFGFKDTGERYVIAG